MAILRTIIGLVRKPLARLHPLPSGLTIGLALACACVADLPAAPPAPASPEYQLKAVFLFNFAQFVDWPPRAFGDPEAPLTIGVLGDDPFGPYLDALVKGEKIGGRMMTVRRFRHPEEAIDCQILFISRSEVNELEKLLPLLKTHSVLTVGDADTFSRQGGIVRLVTENGKIRMRINLQAAKAAGLEISSKLLRPATIVTAEQN